MLLCAVVDPKTGNETRLHLLDNLPQPDDTQFEYEDHIVVLRRSDSPECLELGMMNILKTGYSRWGSKTFNPGAKYFWGAALACERG